jgi:hypothetical protein
MWGQFLASLIGPGFTDLIRKKYFEKGSGINNNSGSSLNFCSNGSCSPSVWFKPLPLGSTAPSLNFLFKDLSEDEKKRTVEMNEAAVFFFFFVYFFYFFFFFCCYNFYFLFFFLIVMFVYLIY